MTACNFVSPQRTFIQMGTAPNVMDNSGMKKLMCTQSLKGGNGAGLGDSIDASVKEAMLNAVQRSLLGGLGNNLSSLFSILNEMTAHNFLSQQSIRMGTVLNTVDNSGAKNLMSTQALKGEKGAELGDNIDARNPVLK